MQLQPWRAKKLPDDSFAYLVPDAELRADAGKMSVKVIVSTQTMDRERDILIAKGCDTSDHQRNPIVLLNHRRDWPGIAQAKTPGGEYTVKAFDDRIEATNYFHQDSKLALQSFRLVESGALKGVSPGFMTVPGCVEKVKAHDGHDAFIYSKWKLVEITHCPIGMNPDALVLAVEKGFGSEQLLPELKELLLPFVPERKAQVTGGYVAKQLDDDDPDPDATPLDIDLSDAEVPPLTSSTAFYHAAYQKAFDGLGMVQELSGAQELERTKADSKAILSHYGAIMDICQKGHANHIADHPDQPGLPGSEHDYSPAKMAEWRVKGMDAWDKFRAELAVDRQHCADIKKAVEFFQTIGNDRTQHTAVRSVAKGLAARLSNVKMVEVPDDDEDAIWGQVSKKLAGVA